MDLGDRDEEDKFDEMNAEFDPLTKLLEKVCGDKVETETVSDRLSDSQCSVTTSEL